MNNSLQITQTDHILEQKEQAQKSVSCCFQLAEYISDSSRETENTPNEITNQESQYYSLAQSSMQSSKQSKIKWGTLKKLLQKKRIQLHHQTAPIFSNCSSPPPSSSSSSNTTYQNCQISVETERQPKKSIFSDSYSSASSAQMKSRKMNMKDLNFDLQNQSQSYVQSTSNSFYSKSVSIVGNSQQKQQTNSSLNYSLSSSQPCQTVNFSNGESDLPSDVVIPNSFNTTSSEEHSISPQNQILPTESQQQPQESKSSINNNVISPLKEVETESLLEGCGQVPNQLSNTKKSTSFSKGSAHSSASTANSVALISKDKKIISVKTQKQLNFLIFRRINKSQLNTTMSDDQQASYEEEHFGRKATSSSFRNICEGDDIFHLDQKRLRTSETNYSFLESSYKSSSHNNFQTNYLLSPSLNTSDIIDDCCVPERCENPLSKDIQFLNLAYQESNFEELKKKILFDEELTF